MTYLWGRLLTWMFTFSFFLFLHLLTWTLPIQPLSAIQHRASVDGTWVNWDLDSGEPDVNPASDACLVFINAIATEGWDRDGVHDDFSDGLVLHVAARCPRTVVVVHAAGVRLVDRWIEHPNVTAAVVAHLPGQDSGLALVQLLYGAAAFSGKLPYTLARNESDYGAAYAPCRPATDADRDLQCDFSEGVYVDYRHFDRAGIAPRFEFGFGLSYTRFDYSDLVVKTDPKALRAGPSATTAAGFWDVVAAVQFTVANVGDADGAEAAQLYLGIPGGPPRQLRGFEKVPLAPGEEGIVTLELTRRDLSVWDVVGQQWDLQPGEYGVYVGASSRDIRLTGSIKI